MARDVVPIASMRRQPPKGGRIRAGKRVVGPKGDRPAKLDRWRFTSHNRAAIDALAELYGGDVAPWTEPKVPGDQWEVITDAAEVRVALPPDALGGTPVYERWSGGGCDRRCDGEACSTYVRSPDGVDLVEVPCQCAEEGALACRVTTRLSVVLPDVPFGGVWRLDTKSTNAARELPGMVDLITHMQDRGLVVAVLGLRAERQVMAGQTRNYLVPYLALPQTFDELAAGEARYRGALEAPEPLPELVPGGDVPHMGTPVVGPMPAEVDDDPYDAVHVGGSFPISREMLADLPDLAPRGREVEHEWSHRADVIDVEDPTAADDERAQAVNVSPTGLSTLAAKVFDELGNAAPPRTKGKTIERAKRAIVHAITDGRENSTKGLRPDEARRMHKRLLEVSEGVWEVEVDHEAEHVSIRLTGDDSARVVVSWEHLDR